MGKPKGAKTRFRGIVRDAKTLGITTRWLSYVLSRERKCESLMDRYNKLKARQAKQKPRA
jgi:hypothetical protein